MRRKILFPFNLGAGNRGCEGIIRGTARILNDDYELLLLDKNQQEKLLDDSLGIDKIGKIYIAKSYEKISVISKLFHKVKRKILKKDDWFDIYPYTKFINKAEKGDVVMFTGGDLYCYKKMAEINSKLVKYLCKKGVITVLWGCSVSEDYLDNDIINALKQYDLITCREHLSIQVLEKNNIADNVKYYPDPAFALEPERIELPDTFNNNEVIGINISNFVGGKYTLENNVGKNIENCIQYILEKTNFNVLIIPHVSWERQDDRVISKMLCDKYKSSDRVAMLDMEKYNYCQIRYIISKCRFFLGARTHAVISAYSTCIPTIALGYSIKSRGIAKDLELSENMVIDCNNLQDENEILNGLLYLIKNERNIAMHLEKVIPSYKSKVFEAKKEFEGVLYQ